MHAQGLFHSASFLKEQVTFISSDCHHVVSLSDSNSHQAKCTRRVINTQYFNSEHSNDVTLSSSNIPVPPLLPTVKMFAKFHAMPSTNLSLFSLCKFMFEGREG